MFNSNNFFSVITNNSNWETLSQNLTQNLQLLLKVKKELRMKNFNIWAFTEKSDFQRGDFTKKQ